MNVRLKYAPDLDGVLHPYEVMVFNRDVFRGRPADERPFAIPEPSEIAERDPGEAEEDSEKSERDSVAASRRRAIGRVRDLITCNPELSVFATFTLNGALVDRYSYPEVVNKLNNFLDNHTRRDGLRYIIIPERHKDGAIHFHGVLNDVLARANSGKKIHGKAVYNLPAWGWGFTTAQTISPGTQARVANYVLKYITKDIEGAGKVGGRYYLHGGALRDPVFRFASVRPEAFGITPEQMLELAPGLSVHVFRDELTVSRLSTDLAEGRLN